MIHLVTGGARSGKSTWAQLAAEGTAGADLLFVATAEALDADMADRIRRHREDRGARWRTAEAPVAVADVLRSARADAIVLDCLTLWVSNLVCGLDASDAELARRTDELVEALRAQAAPTWIVTNEVGLGIVPADALSRRYRDALGRCNQRVAAAADRVTLMVAGLPLSVR